MNKEIDVNFLVSLNKPKMVSGLTQSYLQQKHQITGSTSGLTSMNYGCYSCAQGIWQSVPQMGTCCVVVKANCDPTCDIWRGTCAQLTPPPSPPASRIIKT